MLQPRFWHLVLFGLLTSCVVYNLNFARGTSRLPSGINSNSRLEPQPGKQHVLLTHGAGFVGSHLALALLEAGHVVTLVDDLAAARASVSHLYRLLAGGSRLKVLSADLSSAAALANVLAAAQPPVESAVLLQPPAPEEWSQREPLPFLLNATSQALSLLQALDNSSVTKLVASSSYAIYGRSAGLPVSEDAPACLAPVTPHGHAALFVESAVRSHVAATPGLRAAILRHGSVMGADPHARLGPLARLVPRGAGGTDAIAACLSAAAEGSGQPELLMPGASAGALAGAPAAAPAAAPSAVPESSGLSCLHESVHIADLAAAIVAVIEQRPRAPLTTYNVGPAQPVTLLRVLEACQRVFGVAPQALLALHRRTPGGGDGDGLPPCHGVVGDVSKLQAETGWRPKYALEDALKHALQWQRAAAA